MERGSGILMHVTSLPSPFGIGDLGPSAYDFVDFLSSAGQKYWQVLPLTPTELCSGNSPYSSRSAFAGNVLMLSPELLVQEGFINQDSVKDLPVFEDHTVVFPQVVQFKKQLLSQAYAHFKTEGAAAGGFEEFCSTHAHWLDDYTLYEALKEKYEQKSWVDWPAGLRDRDPAAMAAVRQEVSTRIEKEKFLQFLFFRQWNLLHDYCREKGVTCIGDIPYYVNHDSADVWAHPSYFKLDEYKQPTVVSGVPPDYFSDTGQRWGTPVFDWDRLAEKDFDWWVRRVRHNLQLYGISRIDHFRAFSAYWQIPASDDTAMGGHWEKCPGMAFFSLLKQEFGELPLIAEDLGILDEGVYSLIDKFNLPGMKVLLFAFGEGMSKNPYIPHNHIVNCVVYTGTHDNNTARGWFEKASAEERKRFSLYVDRIADGDNVPEIMQRLALMSVARLAVLPMQDILGLGEKAIMNRPSTVEGNWSWRLLKGNLTSTLASHLRALNQLYDRI